MSKARDLANLISTGADLADGLVNGGELEFTAAEAITAGQAVALDNSAQLVSIKAPITDDTDYASGNATVETTFNQGTDRLSSQCYIKEHNIMVIASGEYGSDYAYIGTYSLSPSSGSTLLDSDTIPSVDGTWSAYTAYNEHTSTLYVACWEYNFGNPEACRLYAYSVASNGTLTRKFNFSYAPTIAYANGAQSVAFAIVPDSQYFMIATGKELSDDTFYRIYRDDTNEVAPTFTYTSQTYGSSYGGYSGDTLGANGLSVVWHPDTSSFIVARRINLDDLVLEKITVNNSFSITNKIHSYQTDWGMHNSLLNIKGLTNNYVLWTGIYDPDLKPYYDVLDIQANSIGFTGSPTLAWDDTFDTDSTYSPSDTVVSDIIYNNDTDIVSIDGSQVNYHIGDVIIAMPSSTDNQVTYKRFRFVDHPSSPFLSSQDGNTSSWVTPTGVSVNLTNNYSTNGIFWSEKDYTHYYVTGISFLKYIAALDTYKPTEVFSNVDDFIGFAQNAIASGSTGKVISSGGLLSTTGLTAGSTYYIDSTSGELTTDTFNRKKAGVAKSTTELMVDDSPDTLGNLDNIRLDTNSNLAIFSNSSMLALTDQGIYGAGGNAEDNISIGRNALKDIRNVSYNAAIGYSAGQYLETGSHNTFIGSDAGKNISSGSGNTILGTFNGNELGLDIRTTDNNIVLSDGAGNPRVHVDTNGITKAQSYAEEYEAVTSTSNATTVNCRNGNSFSHTLTENTTFTFSNPPATGTAYSMSVEIIQDAGASGFTVTWPTSVDFPAATAPTLTATASAVDVFVFTTRDGGTTWYGFTAGQALA